MPTAQVNLIKGDKVSSLTDYRDSLPVNMYAVKRDILGSKGYMLCYPGISSFTTGYGIDRGAIYNERQKTQFRVSNDKLIKISSSGTVTSLGDIAGSSQVAMPYSFNTQAIIADGNMFLYSPDTGFSQITDSDLGSPIDGVWIDGYYFLTDGEYIYHTDIDDETSIDPLKFATAEFMPDPSLGVGKTQDNKVIVFGRYTIEYFVDIATDNFSFQRVETRAQKIGIVATHAKCESGTSWYFTGGRKNDSISVFMLGVGSSQKISTREIDKIISKYTEPELSDMRMESRMEDDTTFILVHLPEETLCFNETIASSFGIEAAWTILKTDIEGDTPYKAINGIFDANLGAWVYGNKTSDKIGKLDNSIFTQFGEKVEWLLYTPFLKLETLSIDEIELDTIPGHTVDEDATVALSLTYDGLTYGKEWFQTYGQPLDYHQRFTIRRLGYVGDYVGFKMRGATKSRMAFSNFKVTYG